MTRTQIVMQTMTPDELDALIRDAEAERERRKVKPCVRRMDSHSENGLFLDGRVIASVWTDTAAKLNIDHATTKRQIALAFCWADWGTRANAHGLSRIEVGTPLHDQFVWLLACLHDIPPREHTVEAARAAGWIK